MILLIVDSPFLSVRLILDLIQYTPAFNRSFWLCKEIAKCIILVVPPGDLSFPPLKERKEMNQIIIINKSPSIALVKHFSTSSCNFFSFISLTLNKKEAEKMNVVQLCPTLCNPLDSSPSGSSVHGIFQAKTLE